MNKIKPHSFYKADGDKTAVRIPRDKEKILIHMRANDATQVINIHVLIDKTSIFLNCLFIWNGLENKVEKLTLSSHDGYCLFTPPTGFTIKEIALIE